ncbi:YfhL family 4Fe-4S dicluster ferredoxin [Thalassotalea sp. HSM 43]|uniref:YfhL family 4Fe-4S dicluster ferredoxin n=1 Tax=Thalassotalea sp. HSM 43 TaxID=2552945 RepID=UPI001080F0B2|nr:YfhL family 4Fe-4S dicluster ferredoxin [Thalassotalea sp. HSM 43]QBY03487.1 YfhL family 4Fe-4S dicluster ferredoxin [Thalassotalea sp. HSM 43]
MALKILDTCINCDMCDPECPNTAIFMGDVIYEIDADRCTECVGHYDTPQCVAACPIDCIKPDPERKESEQELLQKCFELHGVES